MGHPDDDRGSRSISRTSCALCRPSRSAPAYGQTSREHPDALDREPEPLPRVGLHLYVADIDETSSKALAAGATNGEGPGDRPYGSRAAAVYDPSGLTWRLATPIS